MPIQNSVRHARDVFESSAIYCNEEDKLTGVYDLVCDLLHYADTLPVDDSGGFETNGHYAARMGLYHYDCEIREAAFEPEDQLAVWL